MAKNGAARESSWCIPRAPACKNDVSEDEAMSGKVFIPQDKLSQSLERLSEKIPVWVPVSQGPDQWGIEFRPFSPGMKPVLDRQSTVPPKRVIFPQTQTLMTFEYVKSPEDPAHSKIKLEEPPEPGPVMIFGARPCDVRGFFTFDRVFSQGPFVDNYYSDWRKKTLFAVLVCREADDACFCSSVGSGPADNEGSDLWITPVEGGYVVEGLNERGSEYLSLLGESAGEAQEAAALKVQEEAAGDHVGRLDPSAAVQGLKDRFEDMGYWKSMVHQCLGCGVCTYVCPTCYCFTITDEMRHLKGERMRSWDSCMFAGYTQEASGHNPRPSKLERYRNRVGHKFSYFPEKYKGMIACCGCGRCIRSCPVSIDIRKVVENLKESAHACA